VQRLHTVRHGPQRTVRAVLAFDLE